MKYRVILLLLLLFLTFSALVANPKKLLYTVANPGCGLLNRGKKKKKSGSAPPLPPRAARSEKKKRKKEITRRIHILSRRYATSRRYAGGLGPSRIRTRIPTTRHIPYRIAKCCCLEKRINKTWNIEFCPQPHDNATFCKRCNSYIHTE